MARNAQDEVDIHKGKVKKLKVSQSLQFGRRKLKLKVTNAGIFM